MYEKIVQMDAPVLRKKAVSVAHSDIGSKKLTQLIARMSALLKKEKNGVGLAAPQVGAPLRLFIVAGRAFVADEIDKRDADIAEGLETESFPIPQDKVFINPELIRTSRVLKEMSEGCLSVSGKYGMVLRHEKASVRALDEKGAPFVYHGTGLIAHIFQHELDHLDGILYIDKVLRLNDENEEHPSHSKTTTKRKSIERNKTRLKK